MWVYVGGCGPAYRFFDFTEHRRKERAAQILSGYTGFVHADATQIHQVLMNLCTNAYHAMRECGGTLVVDLARKRLSEENAALNIDLQPRPYAVLTVTDTGCGMDRATRDRIFDPYFTTKEKGEGTGLGLAVVHSIVRTHEGAITVYSEPGLGTTFTVFLPLCRDEGAEADAPGDIDPPIGHERVLFVDDEDALGRVAKKGLEKFGYVVTTFVSPIDALERFRESPGDFDVVVSDLTMPKMTGIDLARHVHEIRPDMPLILCSGFGTRAHETRGKQAGVKKFLEKPVYPDKLGWAIRQVMEPAE
jgi:CheY-like chemotaxis protein